MVALQKLITMKILENPWNQPETIINIKNLLNAKTNHKPIKNHEKLEHQQILWTTVLSPTICICSDGNFYPKNSGPVTWESPHTHVV